MLFASEQQSYAELLSHLELTSYKLLQSSYSDPTRERLLSSDNELPCKADLSWEDLLLYSAEVELCEYDAEIWVTYAEVCPDSKITFLLLLDLLEEFEYLEISSLVSVDLAMNRGIFTISK